MGRRSVVASVALGLGLVLSLLVTPGPLATAGAAAPSVTLRLSAQTVEAGEPVIATVRVRPAALRRVRLERRTGSGWRAIATKSTSARGRVLLTFRPSATMRVRAVVLEKKKARQLVSVVRHVTVTTPDDDMGFDDPQPLDVTYTVDAARETSATVSAADGGELEATGSDGTRYTLRLPPGALRSDTEMTMVPVTHVGGGAVGRLLAAVEIQPHGLVLARPATLTITPAEAEELSTQRAFLMDEGGRDFHAYPGLRSTQTSLTLTLWHFSTPGVGLPPAGAPYFAFGRMPQQVRARLEQLLVESVGRLEPCALIKATFEQRVNGRMVDAARRTITNETQLATALAVYRDAIAWAQDWTNHCGGTGSRNLPLDPQWVAGLDPEYMTLTTRIVERIAEYLLRRCYEEHQLGDIATLLSLAAQLTELTPHGDVAAWLRDKARGCAWFDVRFSARYKWHNGFDEHGDIAAGFEVPVSVVDHGQPVGQGPVDYTEFFFSNPGDAEGVATVPGEVRAWVVLDLNAYQPADPGAGAPPSTLQRAQFVIGGPRAGDGYCGPRTPQEIYQFGDLGTGPAPLWMAAVGRDLPSDQLTLFRPGDSGCSLTVDMTFGPEDRVGATLVRRQWQLDCPGGCSWTESLEAWLEVRHTPQP